MDDPKPARRGRRGRWLRRLAGLLVLVVLAGAGVAYRAELGDLGDRWLGDDWPGHRDPSPVTEPDRVLPPPGLRLPAARSAGAVAASTRGGAVDGAAVRRAVDRLVTDPKLGSHVVVRVARASDGTVVYRHGDGPVTPASTLKLLTTTAALQVLGPDHRFVTSVVATRSGRRVVLVGGGDPLLARAPGRPGGYPHRADLRTLAAGTAARLRAEGRTRVRLGYDTSLFSGPAIDPHWEPSYVPEDVVSPISSLWVDEGRARTGDDERSTDPARAAARLFARALTTRGVTVLGSPAPAVAPPDSAGGRELAQVRGAPLAEVVQHVLEASDNEGAEVLARQVAAARGVPASFASGARTVRTVLGGLGVDTSGATTYDGSGLSRQDRVSATTLLQVLEVAAAPAHPGLRAAVANLPVAGFTGSLASRFERGDPLGLGRVRAKTGTLSGVHGLAGTATTADGAVLIFVAVADRVRLENTLDARSLLDRVAAALAGCRCRAAP